MSDVSPSTPQPQSAAATTCARCDKALTANDRVEAGDRVFCRSCYETLKVQLQQAADSRSRDVNYPRAAVGALLGGALGVLLWWGFTVLTKFAFGLAAVAIGFLVGHGTTRFAGGKRSAGLQGLAVVVATVCFAVARYLVNMTFINQTLARQGETWRVSFPPPSLDMFGRVVALDFGIMDAVFLAIVVWQAWSIPRPLELTVPG